MDDYAAKYWELRKRVMDYLPTPDEDTAAFDKAVAPLMDYMRKRRLQPDKSDRIIVIVTAEGATAYEPARVIPAQAREQENALRSLLNDDGSGGQTR